jgi:hypothetical protein
MLTVTGKISVAKDRISCDLSRDFCHYYKYLIERRFPNLIGGLFLPRHGCHITVAQPKFRSVDYRIAKFFDNEIIALNYDPRRIFIGGFGKGFVGFYLQVTSKRLQYIQRTASRRINGDKEGSFHITICSTKHLK